MPRIPRGMQSVRKLTDTSQVHLDTHNPPGNPEAAKMNWAEKFKGGKLLQKPLKVGRAS
jgi:hypothetical protein